MEYNKVNADKNLYCVEYLPLITIYDDNWFLRNDYDVLSFGQREYLIRFFEKLGAQLVSGRTMQLNELIIEFPRPQSNLAVSGLSNRFYTTISHTYLLCHTHSIC